MAYILQQNIQNSIVDAVVSLIIDLRMAIQRYFQNNL